MRNPLKKNNSNTLIAGIIIGSVAAGSAAYLLFTKAGTAVRQQIAEYVKSLKNNASTDKKKIAAKPATDYMHHKLKHPKTDRKNLFKHNTLQEESAGHHEDQDQHMNSVNEYKKISNE